LARVRKRKSKRILAGVRKRKCKRILAGVRKRKRISMDGDIC